MPCSRGCVSAACDGTLQANNASSTTSEIRFTRALPFRLRYRPLHAGDVFGDRFHLCLGHARGERAHHPPAVVRARAFAELPHLLEHVFAMLPGQARIARIARAVLEMAAHAGGHARVGIPVDEEAAPLLC